MNRAIIKLTRSEVDLINTEVYEAAEGNESSPAE
jgi:hypothetical protein